MNVSELNKIISKYGPAVGILICHPDSQNLLRIKDIDFITEIGSIVIFTERIEKLEKK